MTKPSSTSPKKAESLEISHKLSVNLLPQEILIERIQSSKLSLINNISIALLIVVILLTSATLGLRFTQNLELKAAQDNLVQAENKITSFKDKEVTLLSLKQRVASIQGLIGGDDKIKSIFNLVIFLTPADIQITEATVDKNGAMSLSLSTRNISSLESLILSLGDKEKNSGLIAKVDMDGLSLGRDGLFRFALKIVPTK